MKLAAGMIVPNLTVHFSHWVLRFVPIFTVIVLLLWLVLS